MTGTITHRRVDYGDLREYLRLLEKGGMLHRIKAEVDLKYEIGAIAARSLERKGPGLMFENIKGYQGMPLVTNIISTLDQVALAFNIEPDEEACHRRVVEGMKHRVLSTEVSKTKAPVKEVIISGRDVDLYTIPTPWWHEHDGAPSLGTAAGVVTRDPTSGILNLGTYLTMIKDKQTLCMPGGLSGRRRSPDSLMGGGAGEHIGVNAQQGKPTPIALAMGMDPLLTFASGTMISPGGDGIEGSMEYEVAGGWRGSPTELVKCELSDLLVPARAEMIIEGEVLPNQWTSQEPHGEQTGFYGWTKAGAPVIKVQCITHRRNPITYGIICQRVEDYPRALLRGGSLTAELIRRTGMTNIREVSHPEVGRNALLIIAADIKDKDEPQRIIETIWSSLEAKGWRWLIVVDDDCNVRDLEEVMWRVAASVQPERDVLTSPEIIPVRPGILHSDTSDVDFIPPTRGMGIDATFKFKERPKLPRVNKVSREWTSRVASRWSEFGLK